jgi:hypothetical protein
MVVKRAAMIKIIVLMFMQVYLAFNVLHW